MYHTMSMNMQRITITIPKYIYENLAQQIPDRGISSFIANVIEKSLIKLNNDPVEEFIKLKKRLPQKQTKEIIKAIKKGRL